MRTTLDPFSVLVNCIAGWMNQHQHDIIDYLIEENRVLRQQISDRRLRRLGLDYEKRNDSQFGKPPGATEKNPSGNAQLSSAKNRFNSF